MRNPLELSLRWISQTLSSFGIIDNQRGIRTTNLAWPRILTGLVKKSQTAADLMMVGFVLGPAAIAGMAFAIPYWLIAGGIGIGFTNGAVGLIAQRFGGDQEEAMDIAIKQSLLLGVLISLPLTIGFFGGSRWLVTFLGAKGITATYASTYLQVLSLAIVFESLNKVCSRTLVSVNDAYTPMIIRAGGALVNIVLNAVFILGLGWGVFGAALGTLIATMLVTTCFTIGFLTDEFPGFSEFPVQLRLHRPYLDLNVCRQLLILSSPLILRRISARLALFPLIIIVTQFGTTAVAAYEIGRRIRGLLRTPNWGFSLAASSLVGQELGKDDEEEAEAYGWDILHFSLVIFGLLAGSVFIFARQITPLFVQDTETIAQAVPFVRVAAISVIPLGIDGVVTGTLRAGGDTHWPLYGRFLGLYGFMIPLAYVGTQTPIGIVGVYLALIAEMVVPAVITYYRFNTGAWLEISRSYRSSVSD